MAPVRIGMTGRVPHYAALSGGTYAYPEGRPEVLTILNIVARGRFYNDIISNESAQPGPGARRISVAERGSRLIYVVELHGISPRCGVIIQ